MCTHLKSVELRYYSGNDLELCLVKFLLKNAMALEKITVMASWNLSQNPEKQVVAEECNGLGEDYCNGFLEFITKSREASCGL
ncbi:hypothetical protein IFM89_023424 [Coptis chinensis]|uniref:FBD domain-containing protein n=1 Tax=Coptis chinensis TaxID=261450 RepID=A0A835H0L9_9MAGN|nr:hypothetical protein IFM89_023424 [Coptis chinensis]